MAKTDTVWANYQEATPNRQLRTIVMLSGEVGVGKTRFALSAAGPILVQSLDRGLEGVVESILEDSPKKKIYVKEYDWDASGDNAQETAIEIREAIKADFAYGLKHARTIVWDRETDIREVFQYAEFGSPVGTNVKDYARLNQIYYNLINQVKSVANVNFFLIQAMRDEWVVGEGKINPQTGKVSKSFAKSGRRIRAGYDRLDELVMTEIHLTREGGEFGMTVGKCRQHAALQDQQYPGMSFPSFGTFLIEGTSEEDWS